MFSIILLIKKCTQGMTEADLIKREMQPKSPNLTIISKIPSLKTLMRNLKTTAYAHLLKSSPKKG